MNQDNLIEPLVEAAVAIVKSVRDVADAQGQPISDLRMPIIVGKTDLRIIIESGPKVAASNAVDTAQARSGSSPRLSRNDAVQAASDILAVVAREMREAHTRYGEWPNAEAKASHDEILMVIDSIQRGGA